MADAAHDTWEPEMDVKPMVMMKWSMWPPPRGHSVKEWPDRVTFWQLVRMKMRPFHQKWVLWMATCDLPEEDDFGEDVFPFTVDIYRDSSTDDEVDGIPTLFNAGLDIPNAWVMAKKLATLHRSFDPAVECRIWLCISKASSFTQREILGLHSKAIPNK